MNLKDFIIKQKSAKQRKDKRRAKGVELGLRRDKPLQSIKKHKSYRKNLIKRLDTLFSLIVRGRAIRAGLVDPWNGGPIQDCFHFITRARYPTRWDFENAIGASKASNINYEHDAYFVHRIVEWYIARFGKEQWDNLNARSHRKNPNTGLSIPVSNIELEAKLAELQEIMRVEGLG